LSENLNYADNEICQLYKQAKNKKEQISILRDLTLKSAKQIMEILEEGGCFKMDIEKQEKILEQYNKKLTDKAIGRELEISQSSVSTFLRRQGLPPNGKKFPEKIEIKEDEEKVEDVKEVPELLKKDFILPKPEMFKEKVRPEVLTVQTEELKQMVKEVKAVLPKSIPAEITETELETNVIDTLTPGQYFYLAKLTLELLKTMWEG